MIVLVADAKAMQGCGVHEEAMAWCRANNLDPNVICGDVIAVSDEAISVRVYELNADGHPFILGDSAATRGIKVPLVEPLSDALCRYADRIRPEPEYAI